ncbi:LOW QUALITY PROTEIN: DNA-directed RNA polymerases I and III subunit RPAC2-like, partial [Eschrichtius robustus]|uniref:LOW QUALITY PROTEIN: DNA-directed RNA polymerases I and III subunit RPAC2-like n=1 Tax=Eschrichtius robustus TaxID=9764 RepID=UPI0035C1F884
SWLRCCRHRVAQQDDILTGALGERRTGQHPCTRWKQRHCLTHLTKHCFRITLTSRIKVIRLKRYVAETLALQHHLRIPEPAPATEEDQELERKISGLKTPMAEDERKTALEMVQAPGTDRHCVTFVLHEEDHTLGNSLRYMIMKNPEVEFCGYTTTHPSESKINLHIQTRGTLPAVEPFQRGLTELMNRICQHALDTFEASIKEYKDQKASRNEATF